MSQDTLAQQQSDKEVSLRRIVVHNLPLLVGLLIGLIVASFYAPF